MKRATGHARTDAWIARDVGVELAEPVGVSRVKGPRTRTS
jgi:hypothetical protein